MSLSPRAAGAARVVGTSVAAVVLSVAASHTSLACSIGDFTATALCDAHGNGVIRVTDKDASGTPARISLYLQLSMPGGERWSDTQTIQHPTAEGAGVDLNPQGWYPGVSYRVHVQAGDQVDADITPLVVIPDVTCGAAASASASVSAEPSTSSTPSPASSATPSATPTSSPSSAEGSSPVPAASSAPSPAGGGTHLADTGASNGTTAFAGTAATLVVAGGGIVVALRRRTTTRGSR